MLKIGLSGTHSPEAVIHSPAAIVAAWPTAVTTSRSSRHRRRPTATGCRIPMGFRCGASDAAPRSSATARSPRGERELSCAKVATGAFSSSIAADELITSVRVPKASAGRGSAYTEIAERRGARALAGAAAVVELDGDGSVASCRVVLVGVADVPLQVGGLESLRGEPIPTGKEIRKLLTAWTRNIPVRADRRADPRYKLALAAEVSISALLCAGGRARRLAR